MPTLNPIRSPWSLSIAGRFALLLAAGLLSYSAIVFSLPRLFVRIFETDYGIPLWIFHLIGLGLVLPAVMWCVNRFLHPLAYTVAALSDGIRSFQDRDFSVRLAATRDDELGDLLRLYNRVGEILQDERSQIRQRELLLQSALDRSPLAIVLVNPLERILYANHEARRLFLGEGRLEGLHFDQIIDACPAEMQQVLRGGTDGIFSVESKENEPETYHLAQRVFQLNQRKHTLLLLRRMTAELSRQEAEIWKKVIRVISHELNNTLAPISSLAHSGLTVARQMDQAEKLEPIYTAIRERIDYLTRFLEGYARFARLPQPNHQSVSWQPWLASLRELYGFELEGKLPSEPGWFDPSQMQQVLINLLKNAVEASDGEPRILVRIDRTPESGVRILVRDDGHGMEEEVMRRALLPFYSTKPSGTGVGLPLCREIVEAHGGSLRIQAGPEGGTEISFLLPGAPISPGQDDEQSLTNGR